MIADGFLLLLPGLAAKFEGLIVNEASATEGSTKLSGLRISGEESIFEGLLDDHGDILRDISRLCNHC